MKNQPIMAGVRALAYLAWLTAAAAIAWSGWNNISPDDLFDVGSFVAGGLGCLVGGMYLIGKDGWDYRVYFLGAGSIVALAMLWVVFYL